MPDREFRAKVKQLATIADPETRTFEATFLIDNPADVKVFPGMTAKVVIDAPAELTERAGMRIPAVATAGDDQGQAYVWVVDEATMRVQRRPVQLGEMTGSEVGVLGGLTDGELIAISGVHQLRDGMPVRRYEP
jgi:RND family efflux transporter MFP subunit